MPCGSANLDVTEILKSELANHKKSLGSAGLNLTLDSSKVGYQKNCFSNTQEIMDLPKLSKAYSSSLKTHSHYSDRRLNRAFGLSKKTPEVPAIPLLKTSFFLVLLISDLCGFGCSQTRM